MISSTNDMEPSPLLLGFFTQPSCFLYPIQGVNVTPGWAPKFVPISNQGKDLKEGRWGNLDESLSFLPTWPLLNIAGSSNGILLVCHDKTTNMDYFVCNPVTKEFRAVPRCHCPRRNLVVSFVCKGDIGTFDEINYEIIRAVDQPSPSLATRVPWTETLLIETFSSNVGQWTDRVVSCPSQVSLIGIPVVLDGLMYTKSLNNAVVVYDPASDLVQITQLPMEDQVYVEISWKMNKSEGKLHYVRSSKLAIEVWVLDDGEWMMKHTRSVAQITQENPHFIYRNDSMAIIQIHPRHSELIFITTWGMPYWYHCATGRVSRMVSHGTFQVPSFPYEWPCELGYKNGVCN